MTQGISNQSLIKVFIFHLYVEINTLLFVVTSATVAAPPASAPAPAPAPASGSNQNLGKDVTAWDFQTCEWYILGCRYNTIYHNLI